MTAAPDPLRDAALAYAVAGYPVFPVKLNKTPLTTHGFKDATTDAAQIRSWWARWPDAGIGMPTGKASGVVPLDVDPRNGGDTSVSELVREHGPFPPGPVVHTGGGGVHRWFAHPGGSVPPAHGFRPGLDLQGDGSYVILPPSPHASGTPYSWEVPLNGQNLPMIPPWLLKLATNSSPAGVRQRFETHKTGKIPHGRHHDFIIQTAASLASRIAGIAESDLIRGVRATVREVIDDADRHEREIADAARSALAKYGQEVPPKRERPSIPESGEFLFRPGQKGRWSGSGLVHVRVAPDENGKDVEVPGTVVPVIAGAVRLRRRVRVEERTYVEVEVNPDERVTSTVPDLLSRLDRDGRVVYHERARDLVPAWFHHLLPETEAAFPTWGFYEDAEGRVVEAWNPTPVLPEQEAAWEEVRNAVERPVTPEDLAAYAKFLGFFHPYEILPILGSAVAAPFAYLLRRLHRLVAATYTWSKRPGLGKTSGAEAMANGLFGRDSTTGGSLNSEFRLPAHLDSYCGPQAVNECERLDWRRLGPDIKAAAEGPLATRRGRADQTMTDYKSREVLLMTSNAVPPLTGTELVRFFLIHMDESSATERKARAPEFEACLYDCRSRPIGPALARRIATAYPTVETLDRRRGELANEIRAAAVEAAVSLGDPRRPGAWAHVYLGLEAFAGACAEAGVAWTIPPVAVFVRDVVGPVEAGVEEMEVRPVDRFLAFLDLWRVRNTAMVKDGSVVKGEGKVILTSFFELKARDGTGHRIAGTYITGAILEEYNAVQDRAGRTELRIGSLKELSELAAREVGLPERAFLVEEGGRPKVPNVRIGGGNPRAAFVPRDQEDLSTVFGRGGPTLDIPDSGLHGGDESPAPDGGTMSPERVTTGDNGLQRVTNLSPRVTAGDSLGDSNSTDVKTPPEGGSVTLAPDSGGLPDSGDLFAGRETRTDRARNQVGGSSP